MLVDISDVHIGIYHNVTTGSDTRPFTAHVSETAILYPFSIHFVSKLMLIRISIVIHPEAAIARQATDDKRRQPRHFNGALVLGDHNNTQWHRQDRADNFVFIDI